MYRRVCKLVCVINTTQFKSFETSFNYRGVCCFNQQWLLSFFRIAWILKDIKFFCVIVLISFDNIYLRCNHIALILVGIAKKNEEVNMQCSVQKKSLGFLRILSLFVIFLFCFVLYVFVLLFFCYIYIYIYIYIFETYCHIFMIINSKIGHDILKIFYSKIGQTAHCIAHYTAYVTAKLICGVMMVLAKLHRKV